MNAGESDLRLGDYLAHILEAARLAREYVQDMGKDDFLEDRRTQQAVVLNIMTIGEACSRILNEQSFRVSTSRNPVGADSWYAQPSRVEMWRGDRRLLATVAAPFGWRCLN